MITITFFSKQGYRFGFESSGHAGYDESGYDIVCAGVSSAVQLTVNGITEIVKATAKVEVKENRIALYLQEESENAIYFLDAFYLQMQLLEETYSEYIKIIDREDLSC